MSGDKASILDEWATEEEFAKANGLTKRRVARLRNRKNGLPYSTEFGGRVMIHIPTAKKWLMESLITPNPERSVLRVPKVRKDEERHNVR